MRESETREVLLDKLIGIQDLEAIKPIHDMDTDLITECTECIIELTGDELPSESALEQMKQRLLQRLFGQKGHVLKYRKGMLRKLLIAAIVFILILAMSISVIPFGGDDVSLLSRWSYYLLHHKSGDEKDFGDYLSIRQERDFADFKSIRQFVHKTGLDVLVPTGMPKGIKVKQVHMYYDSILDCSVVIFKTNDPLNVSFIVRIGKETNDLETRERTERIGAYDCGLSFAPGQCQCEFNYNGNGYSIVARSKEEIIFILNNLKGSMEK